MHTWKKLIADKAGDDKIIACTLSEDELIESFDMGCASSKPFTAWSERYVYFPVVYDHSEWVERVPRNPCNEATDHCGSY